MIQKKEEIVIEKNDIVKLVSLLKQIKKNLLLIEFKEEDLTYKINCEKFLAQSLTVLNNLLNKK